ncbi:MAG: precorrin-2 C(20)-methyltransferase, partial [Clostridia bacterium]|nr:precorrin-2 C(20)-methyltransferase [Clostridia bacterium]
VGPGDPELVTLKAYRILQAAPVICVPKRGLKDDGYAYGIVRDWLDPSRQELLSLEFPMTKDRQRLQSHWRANAQAVLERLRQGLDCAFITEGDPLLYSTFGHVARTLRQLEPSARVEVVPGVSSVQGAAARVGRVLAEGGERVAILPATYEDEELGRTLRDFDTVVLLKVNSVFDRVLGCLEELGLVDKAVYVEKGTHPEEEVIEWDIRRLQGRKLAYLSLLIVRK